MKTKTGEEALRGSGRGALAPVVLALGLPLCACSVPVRDFGTGGGGGSGATGMGDSGNVSSSSGGGSSEVHAGPPAPPPTKAPDGTTPVTFAIKRLYFGDTNRDGTPDKLNAWKQYGFDLDGKLSTATSTELCQPRNNALPDAVYPDGNDGIDNAFGKNVLPILLSLLPDLSGQINAGIDSGSFTSMLSIEKLGAGVDYNPLLTRMYGGANLGYPPRFDGTDKWPVQPELLTDPTDITTAKSQFPGSYLVKNTWVSGAKSNFGLELSMIGSKFKFSLTRALISMDLDEAHKNATKGTIAGVIATAAFTAEFRRLLGSVAATYCQGPTTEELIAKIEQASDILQDGTQDPSKTCDGISIALGFDAAVVDLGSIAAPSAPVPDPCAATP